MPMATFQSNKKKNARSNSVSGRREIETGNGDREYRKLLNTIIHAAILHVLNLDFFERTCVLFIKSKTSS